MPPYTFDDPIYFAVGKLRKLFDEFVSHATRLITGCILVFFFSFQQVQPNCGRRPDAGAVHQAGATFHRGLPGISEIIQRTAGRPAAAARRPAEPVRRGPAPAVRRLAGGTE